MGWEGPAHGRPRRLGSLMAVAVSVLICGPGVSWNAVVFAQIPGQVTSGTSTQSTHNSLFPASLPSSVDHYEPSSAEAETSMSLSTSQHGQPTTSFRSASEGKPASSTLVISPSEEPKSHNFITEAASSPGIPSKSSSLTSMTRWGGYKAPPSAVTNKRQWGTSSRPLILPSLEESFSTTDSAQASGSTTPGTVPDTAANLHVTDLPKASSTRKTHSSSATITAPGSTQHPTAFPATSLDTPLSASSARVIEVSTSVRTLSPVDTAASYPITTSLDNEQTITSFPETSGINQTPQSPELTTLHVSIPSSEEPGTQADRNDSFPTSLPDSASTLNLTTREYSSAVAVTSSMTQRDTNSQEPMSEPETSPSLSIQESSAPAVMTPPEVTLTLSTSSKGYSLKLPALRMTASPISRRETHTASMTPMTTDTGRVSASSLGLLSGITHSAELVKSTSLVGVSTETGKSSSPTRINTSMETLADSETTTDTTGMEEIHPSTDAVISTKWATSSGADLRSAPTHPESHTVTPPVVTAFTTEAISFGSATSPVPKSAKMGAEPVSSQTHGLRETSTSQDFSKATDTVMVFSQVSSAEVTRTEATSSDRTSGPDFTQSVDGTDVPIGTDTTRSTSPPMAGSSHKTFTTPSPSRAITKRTLPQDSTATASWEGTPSVETQGCPLSETSTPMSTGLKAQSQTRPFLEEQTKSLSPLVPVLSSTSASFISSKVEKSRAPSSPPASGLTPSSSFTHIQSQKSSASPGTSTPEDSSWYPSTATEEGKTPEVAITTSVARPPAAVTYGLAETTATKESSPHGEPSSVPAPDNSIPFTSKNLVPDFLCFGVLRFARYN